MHCNINDRVNANEAALLHTNVVKAACALAGHSESILALQDLAETHPELRPLVQPLIELDCAIAPLTERKAA